MRLALVTLVVADYDAALAFYVGTLGFALVEDTPLEDGKRWVVVAPPGGGASLLLARAASADQRDAIGRQAGGRVAFFLETEDIAAEHARLRAAGVTFVREPEAQPYGTVAVLADLHGNLWDLIEPATGSPG